MPKTSQKNLATKKLKNLNHDTIVAIATPPGYGGVGILRVSGSLVSTIAKHMLGDCPKPRYASLSPFTNQQGEVIDNGIALYFKAPHSFTGDDVLELQAHGGPVVLDELLQTAVQLGARIAEPGEFSKVAFLNNKMDLTQAEAIADLISATSRQAAHGAMRSLQGEFSQAVSRLLQQLIHCRMQVEAAIDFPDEDIDFVAESTVISDCEAMVAHINQLLQSAQQGALLREGITVVIAGRPNAGKSSLLNYLSGEDTAIVTEQAGTTRDILREKIHIDGMPLHIIDTAGLRDSDDVIEQEGIKRAWQQMKQADLVLFMVDAQQIQQQPEHLAADLLPFESIDVPILLVKNKIDQTHEQPEAWHAHDHQGVAISVKSDSGMEQLKVAIKDFAGYQHQAEGNFTARRRHVDALSRATVAIATGINHYQQQQAAELLAEELKQAQQALSEITGEFSSDDLLGEIFSSFCIGK
ncbi:MAG: tRNA uridine-5-carboxymethylaminomethyl(34) synthesis GTPase MnmE [Coxiellaceae bacterium]|nr:tRNA uridine-5-carboxymethylaminomethyl(34) synthesis GTPase MnmE [Coxiellaceae bacterium]